MTDLSRRDVLRVSATGALAGMAAMGGQAGQAEDKAGPPQPAAKPPISARMFWTWDHSTEWALNRPGAQTMGAANVYTRGNAVFLQDYTNLFHWCGRHGIDAVVVWGLL